MNGITEPLPGLLDDPLFQIADLPALTDFHIAPLRNPAPSRHANIPLPLEPVAGNILHNTRTAKDIVHVEDENGQRRTPKITPNDVLLAREAKKPHLAISELLEDNDGPDVVPTQLPSFISLSVVEKSAIQMPSSLERGYSQKRLKLDKDHDPTTLDMTRHLPRPAQKEGRQNRPAPLLPAMVTGLHEPPPSAALLPSIDVEFRPVIHHQATISKIHVKDMLTESDADSAARPAPESICEIEIPPAKEALAILPPPITNVVSVVSETAPAMVPWRDNKPRRARRKWTESETKDLLAGVRKYGVGKWKQILDDQTFNFCERSSVDLKDRYRVCANNDSVQRSDILSASAPTASDQSPFADGAGPSLSPQTNDTGSPGDQNQFPKLRRKRRAWTLVEDESLLKGVARHGFQWTAIHDDPELELSHRRATDLRDRIRNKFPDGYRHAETAPLRSEVKKAEKLAVVSSVNSDNLDVNQAVPSSKISLDPDEPQSATSSSHIKKNMPASSRAATGKVKLSTSTSSLTMLLHSDTDPFETSRERFEKQKDRDREKDHQQAGVTLPSFTFGVDDDMDWEDNRLPPLHEWDEIGI